jgi:LysM repeat protein
MSDKENPQRVIEAYRKQQQRAQRAPMVIGGAAVLLIIGAALIIFWLLGPDKPQISLFATVTPTPTVTETPTSTATQTATATITPTETVVPTETLTPTVSGPFSYQVQEDDTLFDIAQRFNVDLLLLITINNLDAANPIIRVGDQITIPGPDTQLPTSTDVPANLPPGTRVNYTVQSGDTMAIIAGLFNSTVDDLKELNEIENENEIFVGQVLIVRVNLVTPIPSNTPAPATVTPGPATAEPTATATTSG